MFGATTRNSVSCCSFSQLRVKDLDVHAEVTSEVNASAIRTANKRGRSQAKCRYTCGYRLCRVRGGAAHVCDALCQVQRGFDNAGEKGVDADALCRLWDVRSVDHLTAGKVAARASDQSVRF